MVRGDEQDRGDRPDDRRRRAQAGELQRERRGRDGDDPGAHDRREPVRGQVRHDQTSRSNSRNSRRSRAHHARKLRARGRGERHAPIVRVFAMVRERRTRWQGTMAACGTAAADGPDSGPRHPRSARPRGGDRFVDPRGRCVAGDAAGGVCALACRGAGDRSAAGAPDSIRDRADRRGPSGARPGRPGVGGLPAARSRSRRAPGTGGSLVVQRRRRSPNSCCRMVARAPAAAPDASVRLIAGNSAAVTDLVRSGAADVGFTETPAAPADLSSLVVDEDELVVVVAPHHPWARARASPRMTSRRRRCCSGRRVRYPPTVEAWLDDAGLSLARAGGGTGDDGHHPPNARAGIAPAVMSLRTVDSDLADGALVQVPLLGPPLIRPLRAIWTGTPGPARHGIPRQRSAVPIAGP